MDCYQIKWTNSAKKELKKLDKNIIPRLISAVEELAKNPYPQGVKKLVNSENNYRIRVGDYRIIYEIKSSVLIIYIIKVGNRQSVYKK
jgi:mRNA interferase RelE/StbE